MNIGSEHRTLREMVADAIVERIMTGELNPGDRLLEEKLAAELGVSRNPVRESIRALEATGLVEVVPRRGAYVVEIDPHDLAQLLGVRAVLEAFAAELAALNRTPEMLAHINHLVEQGAAASRRDDLVTAAACHRDFHLAIEQASGNPYIEMTAAPLRRRTELAFSMLSDSRSMLSWEEHRRIHQAIADGDPKAAKARTAEHMAGVIADLTEVASRR